MKRVWVWLALVMCWSHTSNAADNIDRIRKNRLAIIIDDIGYNKTLSERAARLPGAFTLSILPFTPYGSSSAHLAHNYNKELMLHTPMSNLSNLPLGRGGLYSGMSRETLTATLRNDLNNVPFIKGMNNHMGSRLTQEAIPMNWVMEELKSRGLYFVDSRTSALTVALDTARAHNIPSIKRDVFLDDDPSISAVTRQLFTAFALAKQHGLAIAIGHPYSSTISVLENIQPLLQQHNIQLVFVSQLLPNAIMSNHLLNEPTINDSVILETVSDCPAPPLFAWFTAPTSIQFQSIVASILFDVLMLDNADY